MTYRTREEVLEQRRKDPVPAFEALLLEHAIMTAQDVAAMRKDVLRETNEATDAAEALPYPDSTELYTHVYEGAWQPWQS
jgi:2-oxoisovalerate dehydrogenase E1 component alpha subunit